MSIKVCCTSDLHENLPEIPDCDLLVLGGDYGFRPYNCREHWWYRDTFAPWIEILAGRGIKIVGIAGNHDFVFEELPHLLPKMPWTYLENSHVDLDVADGRSLRIWGSPNTPRFFDWAFNSDEEELEEIYEKVPDDRPLDILITHGPPYGYGDVSNFQEKPVPFGQKLGTRHCGSPSLWELVQRMRPKLHVFGHFHRPGSWIVNDGHTLLVNVSLVNNKYKAVYKPVVVEL